VSARLTVQFQSVLEKFTPHDAVFSFAAATELTESALSSACMLHASVGSLNSSTSSLHRHRLGEITEDVEEGGGEGRKSGLRHSVVLSDADSGFKEGRNNLTPHVPTPSSQPLDSHLPKSNNPSTPTSQTSQLPPLPTFDKSLPAIPRVKAPGEELVPPRPEEQRPSLDSRRSSQSTRLSALEPDRANSYTGYTPYKPKVKLGPRPSAQRPRTPGSRGEARPVANLPNSVRISNRPSSSTSRPPSSASHRPTSQQSNKSAHSQFISHHDPTPPPPLPHPSIHISALYQPPDSYLLNRPTSSARSATFSVTPSITHVGPPGITPEKQRLMRALQLRKKQQIAKASQVRAPILPAPAQEISKKQEPSPVSSNSERTQTVEGSVQHIAPQSTHATGPNTGTASPSTDNIESNSVAETRHSSTMQSQIMSESIGSPLIDSSLDSKDVDMVSSTIESESATSEASEPSLKSISIVQSMSPVLPPIALQNRLSIGVSSAMPEQVPAALQQARTNLKAANIAEEEEERVDVAPSPQRDSVALLQRKTNSNAGAAAEEEEKICETISSSSPQYEFATPVTAFEEQPPQLKSAPPVTTDNVPSPSMAQSRTSIDGKSSVSDTAETPEPQSVDRRLRRRGMVESQEAVTSPEASDTSDDGSLYDELQSATVEEAKPVMVARSPINAVFNRGSPDRQRQHDRSISIATRRTDESPKSTPEKAKCGAGRGPSSALPQWPPAIESAQSLLIKKTNVSTGITKRIRALEMFSGRSDGGAISPNSAGPPSPPLTSGLVKKRLSSHSPKEPLVRNVSMSTPPPKQLQYPSPAPTPTPASAAAEHQPSWLQRNGPSTEILAPRKKGDSISVTARIIRDSAEIRTTEPSNPSKPTAMNLHRSPLVVEHENAKSMPQREASKVVEPVVAAVESKEPDPIPRETPKSEDRRFSLSSVHSNSGQMTQSESFTKRLSMTIRHARTESRTEPSNLLRSASDSSSIAEDKFAKESRKTRLMKRMSVLTAGSRRSIASAFGSNTLRQEDPGSLITHPPDSIAEHSGETSPDRSSISESQAHVVDIGDVNIQFPDTLLWKRRFMRIDDQGFLILTPPTMEANKRGVSRRFHLSDIKKPCLPALEREELPWSILLDFEDGSCLQVACESRYAQRQVLRSRPTSLHFFDRADLLL
jgi:hypothetical protein